MLWSYGFWRLRSFGQFGFGKVWGLEHWMLSVGEQDSTLNPRPYTLERELGLLLLLTGYLTRNLNPDVTPDSKPQRQHIWLCEQEGGTSQA